ncbi:hypothetical protein TGDOM2_217855 [Toxoplasma gondii GAB2-2007-GAL-DOM2]|uniref:Uncharacterized protein n=3 Tax=Toxoplasma gondii TaxID=5811 RepID=A0A086L1M0_TOXGO|nr:hypothetical protein TGDOM2_217855 [Toxoplasma gondii GAB2-2007-GAL-DOM2]KFG50538.1 hypothetical protein TGFOU_217855 [Toxoplasma gondii FOU]KFH12626.1 hypothetical protein TGVAND_217855 [Toxoplasma gondii VAND]
MLKRERSGSRFTGVAREKGSHSRKHEGKWTRNPKKLGKSPMKTATGTSKRCCLLSSRTLSLDRYFKKEGVYKFCPPHDGLAGLKRSDICAGLESPPAFSANCSGSLMGTQVTARLRRALQLQVTFKESEEVKGAVLAGKANSSTHIRLH